jgi:SNF2 family DNA or RNA helicase
MRPHGDNQWKLKGMKTALHHYQAIGAGRMREQEGASDARLCYGGLLSDEMGLGKTVMAIANMVDGRPDPSSKSRATLIITPAALQKQWYNEIRKHVDSDVGYIKNLLLYKSSIFQNDLAQVPVLSNFDVVIASYHEIVKSYPKKVYPLELTTDRAKEEWWANYFEENKGLLHRVKWHRIVLDEAQAIKNHTSRTSEGCWRLRGRFRWTLSGTPVVNSLEEFYAYFRFLKMFATGDYETWRKNYCKKGSEAALTRLRTMLEKIMIRRTHQDQLFGRPLITLPKAKEMETIMIDFTPIERAMYKIIRDRFVAKIKTWQNDGEAEKNYYSIFILLLRLRQLTAHFLLMQKTLKDLLHIEDLEKLWQLTETYESNSSDATRRQARALRAGLENIKIDDASRHRSTELPADIVDLTSDEISDDPLGSSFRNCLENMRDSGQWLKANMRSTCPACSNPPMNPQVTDCLHIYCLNCIDGLKREAELEGHDSIRCLECSVDFRDTWPTQAFVDAAQVLPPPTPPSDNTTEQTKVKGKSNTNVEEDVDWFKLPGPILRSSKTIEAVKQMKKWFAEDPTSKVLLFSQWRGVLRVFDRVCKEEDWPHTQFHGAMSFDARNKAIEAFTDNPDCRVLIAAMKAGGVGLNLTAANRVILIDLWWNIAMETQAFCRVFRIGQTREVEVVRFAVKNTVDVDIMKMQERKMREIDSAMEKKNRGGPGGLPTRDLMRLFGFMGDDEAQVDEFIFPNDPYERVDSDVEEFGGGDADGEPAVVIPSHITADMVYAPREDAEVNTS